MKPRYSGDKSVKFWQRVRALPDHGKDGATLRSEVYSLGCALQDLEGRTLAALKRAEEEAGHRVD